MNSPRKPYVKPEITIIPPNSPKYKEILQHLERQSRGQRFNSAALPVNPTFQSPVR
mgnify:CR=1 FL=1